jgi:phosphoglycolate phosphatase
MSMQYSYLLFDLDGTITDSAEGIMNALTYALGKAGIHEEDKDTLRAFIGSSLKKSLQEAYELSKERAEEISSDYRSYYIVKGVFQSKLYPGILELLSDLKKAGKYLIVATSKRTTGANQVLDIFKLHDYFDLVMGGSPDGTISEKSEVIRAVFAQMGDAIKPDAVMIGDRKYDIFGAHENGIDSIAVMYGYATKAEIDDAKPTYRVNTVDELRGLLLI